MTDYKFSEQVQDLMLQEIKHICYEVMDNVQEFSNKFPDEKENMLVQGILISATISNLTASLIHASTGNRLDYLEEFLETIKRTVISKLMSADLLDDENKFDS